MHSICCILTTCNRPEFFKRAFLSVLNQSIPLNSIYVIDDSKDPSIVENIIAQSPTVKYCWTGGSKGACFARNLGLNIAKEDMIAFLDDDDHWISGKIEEQSKYVADFDIIGCRYIMNNNNKETFYRLPFDFKKELILVRNLLGSMSLPLIKRELIGQLRFDERLELAQDWDFWIKILYKSPRVRYCIVPKYLCCIDDGNHSRVSHHTYDQSIKNHLIMYQNNRAHYTSQSTACFIYTTLLAFDKSFVTRIKRLFCKASISEDSLITVLFKIIIARISNTYMPH